MKLIKRPFVPLIVFFVTLALFIGCARPKPSDSKVKEIVRIALRDGVPTSWIGSAVIKTGSGKIELIEIKEWGTFNTAQNYWPVRIRVVGSAEAFTVGGSAGEHDFDTVEDVRLSKDDYGKWKVRFQPRYGKW